MVVVKWCKNANETNATSANANTMMADLLSCPRRAFLMVTFSNALQAAEGVLLERNQLQTDGNCHSIEQQQATKPSDDTRERKKTCW